MNLRHFFFFSLAIIFFIFSLASVCTAVGEMLKILQNISSNLNLDVKIKQSRDKAFIVLVWEAKSYVFVLAARGAFYFECQLREYYATYQERREQLWLLQSEYQNHVEQGRVSRGSFFPPNSRGCPAFFDCLGMSGVRHSKDCPNLQTCKSIGYSVN